jgi:hypothetical protein
MNNLTLEEYKTAPIEKLLPVLVFMKKHNVANSGYDGLGGEGFFRCARLPCRDCILMNWRTVDGALGCRSIHEALAKRFNLKNIEDLDLSQYEHSHPEHFI